MEAQTGSMRHADRAEARGSQGRGGGALISPDANEPRGRERVLQIRLSDDEYAALGRIARAQHLRLSTWARQQLLWILEEQQGIRVRGPDEAPE